MKGRLTSMEKQYHRLHALILREKLGRVFCLFLRGPQLQIFHHSLCTAFTQHSLLSIPYWSIYVAIPQSLAPFIAWHLDASKSLKLFSFQLIPPETQLTILKERTEAQKNRVGLISPNVRSQKCRCLH